MSTTKYRYDLKNIAIGDTVFTEGGGPCSGTYLYGDSTETVTAITSSYIETSTGDKYTNKPPYNQISPRMPYVLVAYTRNSKHI